MNDNNRQRGYYIPINIFDGASFLGVALRNWIEAAVLAVIPGWLFWKFVPIGELSMKVIIMLIVCLPLAVFALVGYNGESLTQFIKTYINFRKNRRVLEYTMEDDNPVSERGMFADLEDEIQGIKTQLADTKDRKKAKELKKQLKALGKELASKQRQHAKEQEAEEAKYQAEREARRKSEEEHADSLAEKEIQRRRSEGEKISKKQIKALKAEYRLKYVTEMPSPPKEDANPQQNLSSQDFIPIDRIEDRCIITKGGRYIRILGVAPLNFPMLSAEQQNYTIDQFAVMLKGGPVNIHIKTMANTNIPGKGGKNLHKIHVTIGFRSIFSQPFIGILV